MIENVKGYKGMIIKILKIRIYLWRVVGRKYYRDLGRNREMVMSK
jgi:hypothetical protein